MSQRPGPVLGLALQTPRSLYRWRLGWLLGRRFLLLGHIGRRSGRHYETVIEVVHYDTSSGAAIVMSGWGTKSDWYRNIELAGQATMTIGRQTLAVSSRVLSDEEAVEVLADYERRNRWIRPVGRAVLSRLAGFTYDGSEFSRLSLVQQVPLVELSPSPPAAAPWAGGL